MGSVTRASAPVPDANVEAMLSTDGCRFGEAIPNNPNQDSVNAAGHYEIVVLPVRPGSYCARLVARWPQDSAVRDSILVEAPSPNTVVVDFTVP